jgi:hypothetical protein
MPKGQYTRIRKATPESIAQFESGVAKPGNPEEPAQYIEIIEDAPEKLSLPSGWSKGALLNVRNTGAEYRITLYPEEFDPMNPERCLRFTNPAQCQDFISNWYSRQSNDPRAW